MGVTTLWAVELDWELFVERVAVEIFWGECLIDADWIGFAGSSDF
jgi:hypothetical protein